MLKIYTNHGRSQSEREELIINHVPANTTMTIGAIRIGQ